MSKNTNLSSAKKAKNDEFYTQLSDIEQQMKHYRKHFKDKTVFLNCDDPEHSMFWKFFALNFDFLGLKRLIATHYDREEPTYKLEITRDVDLNDDGEHDEHDIVKTPLKQNGDFRSPECIELLKESDIVCTNPPFSLFREYVAQLMEYEKKFIIIGNQNALTYKEIFPLIKDNKMWLGYGFNGGNAYFRIPPDAADNYAKGVYDPSTGLVKFRNCAWFTNLDIEKRHEELITFKNYNPDDYPTYDNYDAIEVGKLANIPCDYEESWGVPVGTELDEDEWEVLYEGKDNKKEKRLWVVPADGTELADKFKKRAEGYVDEITQALESIVLPEYRNGCMGVPITFIDKYNPDQMEIKDANEIRGDGVREKTTMLIKDAEATITTEKVSEQTDRQTDRQTRTTYARVVIKRRSYTGTE